jgi:hypothetical protein
MKKIYFLILFFILLFSSFIIIMFIPKNYTIDYTINNYKVIEKFNKKVNYYALEVTNSKKKYAFIIDNYYSYKRKIIQSIKISQNKNVSCVKITIKNGKYYYSCKDNNTNVDINLLNKTFLNKYYPEIKISEEKLILDENNIFIYNNDKNYLLWNYNGFYFIKNNKLVNKKLLAAENYDNKLGFQMGNYFIFPNYDSKYFFNEIIYFNSENGKYYKINSNYEISYDSYYLGSLSNKLYLVDNKNKKEYLIDIKKNKIKDITTKEEDGLIYQNDKWGKISMIKLVNNSYAFSSFHRYNYYLDDNILYLKINDEAIKLSNNKINKILNINDSEVYYLSSNKLYLYKYGEGEKKLIVYDEWNFHTDNQIYVFDK